MRLGDVFGNRHHHRHRLERPAQIIRVEPGDDHPLAAAGKLGACGRQILVEELGFVDADDLGVVVDEPQQLRRVADVDPLNPHLAVRHDFGLGEAVVERRLEDLHALAGDLRAPQPADELFALSAEHAAGDDFDPAVGRVAMRDVHQARD